MSPRFANELVTVAKQHGHRAEVLNGEVLVYTEWVDGNGNTGEDCDKVKNIFDLRRVLGYGD